MYQRLVAMPMCVRRRIRHWWVAGAMRMPVMLVVHVSMVVFQRLVSVLVLVPLAHMKPHSDGHQPGRDDEHYRRLLPKDQQRQQCPDERRSREVSSGASGTELSEGNDEQHQTHSVAQKADDPRRCHQRRCRPCRTKE